MGISFAFLCFDLFFFRSYPHVGLQKDPPYTYKDTVDKYDAPMDAERVK